MWDGRRRLLLLIGLAVALAGVYLAVHVLPGWMSPGDGRAKASVGPKRAPARPDGTPGKEGPVVVGHRQLLEVSQGRDPANLPLLREAAGNADWRTRVVAVTGIGQLGKGGDPELLLAALRNARERPEVRAAAAEALGAMRYYQAGPALIEAMDDGSPLVRAPAGVALRKIMGVHYGYRAADPPQKRREALELIREQWPVFYAHAQRKEG